MRKLRVHLPPISCEAAFRDGTTGRSALEEGVMGVWCSLQAEFLSEGGGSPRSTQSLYDLVLPVIALKSRAPGSVLTPFIGL